MSLRGSYKKNYRHNMTSLVWEAGPLSDIYTGWHSLSPAKISHSLKLATDFRRTLLVSTGLARMVVYDSLSFKKTCIHYYFKKRAVFLKTGIRFVIRSFNLYHNKIDYKLKWLISDWYKLVHESEGEREESNGRRERRRVPFCHLSISGSNAYYGWA